MPCLIDAHGSKPSSSVSVAVIRSLTKGLTHWLNARGKSVMDLTGCANPLPRFWCSAVLFWAGDGDRSAWPLSAFSFLIILGNLGTLYGINVWSGELFNALEKYQTRTVFFPVPHLFSASCHQRPRRAGASLGADDLAASLARVAQPPPDGSLAGQRPLLSAQSPGRRAQEPRIPNRRRPSYRDRSAGRVCHRPCLRTAFGCNFHFCVVVSWWSFGLGICRRPSGDPGLPGHHCDRVCGACDHVHRVGRPVL